MGAQLASSIINKTATVLFDVNNIKWGRTELLGWLNDAQRALVALVPEASSKRVAQIMVAGARQALPADAHMLLEVARNMGTAGTVAGRVPKRIDREILDESNPDWSSAAAVTAITTYMYNMRDRLAFYVSPPSDATGYLEIIYSAIPVALIETDPILVSDVYVPALMDYMLWRAKSKNTSFAGSFQEAQSYYTSFMAYVSASSTDMGRLAGQMGALKETPPQGQGSIG